MVVDPAACARRERLIVGTEHAYLGWFYEGDHVINHDAFSPAVVDEYLRTFSGREGVLGSFGVNRAAFTSIAQTEPLLKAKIKAPVWAMGGEKGLGARRPDGRAGSRARPDLGQADQRPFPSPRRRPGRWPRRSST